MGVCDVTHIEYIGLESDKFLDKIRRPAMAYIRTVPPEESTGKLRELYDENIKNFGYVRSPIEALSLRPEAMAAWQNLLSTIRSPMNPRHYELLTVVAASRLNCSS